MARSFTNNTTDQVAVGSIAQTNLTTISIWAKSNLVPAYNNLFSFGASSTNVKFYFKSNGKTALYVAGTPVYDGGGAASVSANTWTNVTVTVNGTSSLVSGYVNNTVDGSGISGGVSGGVQGTTVYASDTTIANTMQGSLADAAAWSVILTSAEMGALANGARPYTIRPASLLFYHPLDGLQSPEPDLSGNKLNGTVTGTALASGPPLMMFTPRIAMTTPSPGLGFSPAWAKGRNSAIEGVAS